MRRDELRPVIDPTLPDDVARRLRRHPELLYREEDPVGRWPRSTSTQALGSGGALAATGLVTMLALASSTAATVLVILLVLMLTGAFTHYVGQNFFDEPWESWFVTPWWSVWIIGSGVAMTAWILETASRGLELVTAVPATPEQVAVAGVLALSGGIATVALARPDMPTLVAAQYRDHYLSVDEFGTRTSEARWMLRGDRPASEAELLAEVQLAIDRVLEGRAVLGDSFNAQQSLALLRDQEWQIALDLRRHRQLRTDLDERYAQAATDRVVAALRFQEEALYRAHSAIQARVNRVRDYGHQVESAVVAHREWEQCLDIAAAADDFVDLLASATHEAHGLASLEEARAEVKATRETRDARIREVIVAGDWLAQVPPPPNAPRQSTSVVP
ncbi:hypothetical protein RIF23_03320 [Lipingzhangella sp. LS1_29]|uniref:Uncharacterized protein n=1 Tax=Lipingzhangella rawalii TaxID=2055835 RepID=A0ABU2H1Z4_9ACTN|nr:hypothetical protein [Lipingzhangella rawalii]MDS1269323.1 hypothetical protein [Lipingzhangella rawalii]